MKRIGLQKAQELQMFSLTTIYFEVTIGMFLIEVPKWQYHNYIEMIFR